MALTNCIITDNGYIFSRANKRIIAPNGTRIADLYFLDLEKMTEEHLIQLILNFSNCYELGQQMVKKNMAENISKIFGLSIDK
jgi:hypothetical protein